MAFARENAVTTTVQRQHNMNLRPEKKLRILRQDTIRPHGILIHIVPPHVSLYHPFPLLQSLLHQAAGQVGQYGVSSGSTVAIGWDDKSVMILKMQVHTTDGDYIFYFWRWRCDRHRFSEATRQFVCCNQTCSPRHMTELFTPLVLILIN